MHIPNWLAAINRAHQAISGCLVLAVVISLYYAPSIVPIVLPLARLALLACLMMSGTVNDLCTRRIPNQVTYVSFFAAGFLLLLTVTFQIDGADSTLSVVEAGLAIMVSAVFMVAGWLAKSVGGGDVKLVVAAGALLGLSNVITCTLVAHAMAIVFLVVVAMASITYQLANRVFCRPAQSQSIRRFTLKTPIPMAGFYALATAMTLWFLPSRF